MTLSELQSTLTGRTIVHVGATEGEHSLVGILGLTLTLDDGTEVNIDARGCDEGGWLEIDC